MTDRTRNGISRVNDVRKGFDLAQKVSTYNLLNKLRNDIKKRIPEIKAEITTLEKKSDEDEYWWQKLMGMAVAGGCRKEPSNYNIQSDPDYYYQFGVLKPESEWPD